MREKQTTEARFRGALCLLVLGVTTAAVAACYPASAPPPQPSPAGVAWATSNWQGSTDAQIGAGRSLFVAHCNACHGYPDVDKVAEHDWPGIVKRMGHKADLDADQTESVLRFVLTARHR